ncbi:MAG TPA: glycine cleavage system aminomethyltransferase GcvT [Bacillota bacterium]|nr:glycine cleavage system aminomethyltransferase GcvT [Bacillota bacterium]
MEDLKKTPLYQEHLELNGKMVDFGGWALPVQYSGILEEVEAVRKRAGIFDVSHMGEIMVRGEGAMDWLNSMVTNDVTRLADGQVMYALMCYPDGGVVDDLLIYRFSGREFLLVVNAANTDKDWQWLNEHKGEGVELENISAQVAQLAVQGPLAQKVIQGLTDENLDAIRFFCFARDVKVAGVNCLISRTGYTGEDGFELYCAPAEAGKLWRELLAAGRADGLLPCGLGARDTLRFKAGLPLYGHEISRDISPLEGGLGFFDKFKKADYLGKEALLAQKEGGLKRRLVGLTMVDKGVPRAQYPVLDAEGNQVGFVTSGSFSPTVNANVANALVDSAYTEAGTALWVEVRKRRLEARVTKLPFYKREAKK